MFSILSCLSLPLSLQSLLRYSPRLFIYHQLDLAGMQVLDYLLHHLGSKMAIKSREIHFYQNYLRVPTQTTIVESGFFLGNVRYHGVCPIIHQDLGYFPVHILQRNAFTRIKV